MSAAEALAASRAHTANQVPPAGGIVWVYQFQDDGSAVPVPSERVDDALAGRAGWTWVHIGISDAAACAWIAKHAPVTETARTLLTGDDEHYQLDVHGNEITGVLPDLQRTATKPGEDLVRLRFAMTERVLITARRIPVHALELARASVDSGRRFRAPMEFLDGVVDRFADAIGQLCETLGDQLDAIENGLMNDELGDEGARLSRIRLQLVRMHRQLTHLCALFHRVEPRIATENEPVARATRVLAQKLESIDHDVSAQLERARLLLDEVGGKMTAVTNRRLFTLSLLTTCLLPPTLVTGFFGMNTKGLPFAEIESGTWWALLICFASGAIAYALLRRMRAF